MTIDEITKRKVDVDRPHDQSSRGLSTSLPVETPFLGPLRVHESYLTSCFFRVFAFRTFVILSIPSILTPCRDCPDGNNQLVNHRSCDR